MSTQSNVPPFVVAGAKQGISPELEAALKQLRPDLEICPRCRCCELVSLASVDPDAACCWSCGGAGEFDLYEQDPINEDPGSFELCPECMGTGELDMEICLGHCDEQGRHKAEAR